MFRCFHSKINQMRQSSRFWMKSCKHHWWWKRITLWQRSASLRTVPKYLSDFTFTCPSSIFKNMWQLQQSPSLRPSPCFKVTVAPVLSTSLLQPVICIHLSLHSDWQGTSSLLYTSFPPILQLCLGRWLHIIISASLYFSSPSLHLSASRHTLLFQL